MKLECKEKKYEINFQNLHHEDLSLMHNWLNNNAHVNRWYTKTNITLDRVVEKYSPYINGLKAIRPYIFLYEGKKIGYIQTYSIDQLKDYAQIMELEKRAAGIDLFIGDEKYIHKGLGPQIIQQFIKKVLKPTFNVNLCIIGPEPSNQIAIKSYKKAGFEHVKTIFNPKEECYEYVMMKIIS